MTILINTDFLNSHGFILLTPPVRKGLQWRNGHGGQPHLASTLLLNNQAGQKILADYYRDFITIARRAKAPVILTTPTGHANNERLTAAGINHNINALAVRFLKYLRAEYNSWAENIYIAGLISGKNS